MKVQDIKNQKEDPINEKFRAGFVAIIGRPSVGKSTFINTVCGAHTAITSPHPQTTRNVVRGIINTSRYQMILLDTPGIHYSETKYGQHLTQQAKTALKDSEAILYMLDATRMPGREEDYIIQELTQTTSSQHTPTYACINKMDKENQKIVLSHITQLKEKLGDSLKSCHLISALHNINIKDLLEDIAKSLPIQQAYYPQDYYTDQSPEFRISEQVRAAALSFVKEEIPHALYTEVIESSIKNTDEHGSPRHLFVRVQIIVERESQKGIIIGKSGSMIKQIRIESLKRLTHIFPYKVQLELKASVKKKWRKDSTIINQITNM